MGFRDRTAAAMLGACLVFLVPCARAATPAARPADSPHAQWLTGSVRAVDPRVRTLDLLTGVGHALRVTRIALPATLGLKGLHAGAPLTTLTPGCVVRVECSTSRGSSTASSVELLQTAPAPGSR